MHFIADRYVLIGEPRRGGMSSLYKALDTKENGKNVAVKLYHAEPIDDEILRESFKRERMALRELKHKNVVSIFDEGFAEEGNTYFIVLEWLESTIADKVASIQRPDWSTFYQSIGRPILEAVLLHTTDHTYTETSNQKI